ncbi:unnamed protein product [Phyllotreta striolata]|uniref:ABC transporter domain-containing protein n=1 Tax=Phyllotreta striolata TaxID=444603 RepID=A0A9N9TBC6_PHYSR|nr:unnamed protein product [Phyllotreta striolata]
MENLFNKQLKAMLKRNLTLKKREKKKTIAEIIFPLYFLSLLIIIKLSLPDPNLPEITTPRDQENLFQSFNASRFHSIAVAPSSPDIRAFLKQTDEYVKLFLNNNNVINWVFYENEEALIGQYNKSSTSIPIAVVFEDSDPIRNPLKYKIRTNPSFIATPSTNVFYSLLSSCRGSGSNLEPPQTCPVNSYYFSDFLAIQTLLDYTKIKLDSMIPIFPNFRLEIFPKAAEKNFSFLAFRMIIPLYMVMAMSQFITYLMMLIVGEKEKKIKVGMMIMGLRDVVYWLSWFIYYVCFVFIVSTVATLLLYSLNVFSDSNYLLIFIAIVLYGLSVIMFGFMVTPFFDKAMTAGVVSNFALIFVSLLFYVTIYTDGKGVASWFLSLLSPVAFAMALDKAIVMEIAKDGLSFNNMFSGEGLPFGGSLILLAFDMVLYGLLAYYLDSVVPSEYGVKRPIFFCFSKSFWCSKQTNKSLSDESNETLPNVEPVATDLIGKEAIKIRNLYKNFKKFRKPTTNAIRGINLSIYEGQITAIIGHNGAGKTTLFNILTGLTAPTSGKVEVFGYDVSDSNDMDRIRRMIGVCPQHDILFDNLTPREHLEFFAAIKGIENIENEVTRTLRDIDLGDKADEQSRHLSGGQKRKLSIGIAIIGNPKIIILDEPTAGVDPYSRRHMWSVLQNIRKGKVILLTTHFMDEADILADRKAVVSKGEVRCCGSSLYLKNKFGVGYHLTMVLEDGASSEDLLRLVKSYVANGEMVRRHGKELSFVLPYDAVSKFSGLFSAIESEINNRSDSGKYTTISSQKFNVYTPGILSYGVSMTTLEEVFLQLQKDEEMDDVNNDSNRRRKPRNTIELVICASKYRHLEENNIEEPSVVSDFQSLESIKCEPSASQTLKALIKLRILRLRREFSKLCSLIVFPIGLTALGLFLSNVQASANSREMNPLVLSLPNLYGYLPISIRGGTKNFEIDIRDSGATNLDSKFTGNYSELLDIYPHIGVYNINRFDIDNPDITILYNDTETHSLPILINLLNNAFARAATGVHSTSNIQVSTHPFEDTSTDSVTFDGSSLILGMVFLYAPVVLAVDMVYDREIKARNQLRVNGLSFTLYFLSFFAIQIALMVLLCASLIVLVVIMKPAALSSASAVAVLSVLIGLYCPASILFTTAASYLFDKSETAQAVMSNTALLLGMVPYLIVTLTPPHVGRLVHCVFSFTDVMYLPYGIIYYIRNISEACRYNGGCDGSVKDYFTQDIVVVFVALLVHIPLWYFMVMVADVKKSGGQLSSLFKKNINGATDEEHIGDYGQNEDEDVRTERQRVKSIIRNNPATTPVVVIDDLHKKYKTSESSGCKKPKRINNDKIAVKSISLAVDAGEVFGLLGHNGAGKTTAMRIITAEESPTRGRVQIAGKSITSNMNDAFQLLGYCPQHDAQWKEITVAEHLEVYAAIKGVPAKTIPKMVELYLTGLQIHEHRNKQSKHCSGGTRRKLSYAMAMVGNPRIVLLDEPSTGMDPESKRFLWDTVLASFKGSKGAILTTHSMEEADILCSRVGIMVNGELRCLGSTQHLKNLYGAGYNLEIKLRLDSNSDGSGRLNACKEFINSKFSDVKLEESISDRLIFSVPQHNVPSLASCFRFLEEAKERLSIEEYSFSQTTLEQVFLKFAYESEIED